MTNTDLLKGAAEIAAYLRRGESAIYHMLESGKLPGFKLSGTWVVRKSTLERHFAKLERLHQRQAETAP